MKKLIVAAALCAAVLPRMAMSDEVELPEGYRQIEYVQGDGQAFIDLGFPMTEKLAVEVVAMPLQECGFFVYGERDSNTSPSKSNFWGCNGADGTVSLEIYSPAYRLKGAGATGNKFEYLRKFIGKKVCCRSSSSRRGYYNADTGGALFSGSVQDVALPAGTTFTSENTCGLFTANGSSFWTVDSAFTGRIYSFTVTQDGEPYMNLVPCLTSDGVAGFYDTVGVVDGKRFYGNMSGKGAFLGPSADGYSLTGDFTLRVFGETGRVPVPAGIGVLGPHGPLAATDFSLAITAGDSTGRATIWATIKAGADAGKVVVRTLPIVRLPKGFIPLEYVQGDGTAYTKIGDYHLGSLNAVDLVVTVTEAAAQGVYGGRRATSPKDGFLFGFAANGTKYDINLNYKNQSGSSGSLVISAVDLSVLLNRKTLVHNEKNIRGFYSVEGTLLANGYENTTAPTETFTSENDFLVFDAQNIWATSSKFKGCIHSLAVTEGGVDKFWLVPCKNADGEVGLYDGLSGAFYGNIAGEGAFIAGPRVKLPTHGFAILLK